MLFCSYIDSNLVHYINYKLLVLAHLNLVFFAILTLLLKTNPFLPWPEWLSWLECHPAYRKVVSLIPGQGIQSLQKKSSYC